MPERKLPWLVVHRHAHGVLPSEYRHPRESPKISTLRCSPSTPASVSWLASAAQKSRKAGVISEDPISSDRKQIRSSPWPHFFDIGETSAMSSLPVAAEEGGPWAVSCTCEPGRDGCLMISAVISQVSLQKAPLLQVRSAFTTLAASMWQAAQLAEKKLATMGAIRCKAWAGTEEEGKTERRKS